jgi:hypothetical protein
MTVNLAEAPMSRRLLLLLPLALLLPLTTNAKDKKKSQISDLILRAQSVRVVIDPNAGEPLDQPAANANARDNVEKALTEWGRYRVVMDGEESDLVIAIHTGDDRMARPTIKGGPVDQRAGVGQETPSSIRIGGQHGQPPYNDPMDPANPQNQGPARVGNEVGPRTDSFLVYQGRTWGGDSMDSPALWRYEVKNCLNAPDVKAVEEFRKAIADAEKPKDPKKP